MENQQILLPNIEMSEIEITTDYNQFELYNFNRDIKKSRINKMIEKFKQTNGNLVPIMISATGKIIDGQHRWKTCKEGKLPLRFCRTNIRDEHVDLIIANINSVAKSLSPEEYARMWADMGSTEYQHYIELMEEVGAKFDTTRVLMRLTPEDVRNKVIPRIYPRGRQFLIFIKDINIITKQMFGLKFREREIMDAIWIIEDTLSERRSRGENLPQRISYKKMLKSFKHVMKDKGVFDRAEYIAKVLSEALDFGRKKEDQIKLVR